MIFSNTHPSYKVCIPYWLDNGNVIQEVRNDEIYVKDGIVGKYFSFKREDSGYNMSIPEISTNIFFDDNLAETDYMKVKPKGIVDVHNKHIPFKGEILGERVSKGLAYIQKVNMNMPFIPWRWGRVFFEDGARFNFFEPRALYPMFKNINFKIGKEKLEFNKRQKIYFKNSIWKISGTAPHGESLKAVLRSTNTIKQTFETPRTIFEYNEMPSVLEEFSIKRGGKEIYSLNSLGNTTANCEDAHYSRIHVLSNW